MGVTSCSHPKEKWKMEMQIKQVLGLIDSYKVVGVECEDFGEALHLMLFLRLYIPKENGCISSWGFASGTLTRK